MPQSARRTTTLFAALAAVGLIAPRAASAWAWDGTAWADPTDFLSTIDAATKAHLQAIVADGVAAGRVEGRMGQIGDSITESSAYFRNAVMNGVTSNETGHDYAPIRSWLAYSGTQPADANSFYRNSGKGSAWGNLSGWELAEAVAAGHPAEAIDGQGGVRGDFSWALIMFGTNDIDAGGWNAASWKEDMRAFVQAWEDSGVVPVLSTIPPEAAHVGTGRVEAANEAVRDLALEEDIPLVDYYALILSYQPTTWHGTLISTDGTHPSAATGGQGFSQTALTSTDGYALRTKLAFDMGEKLRTIVFDDGDPDVDPTATPVVASSARSLIAFPNPTRGHVSFAVERSVGRGSSLRVFDASGRLIRDLSAVLDDAGATASWDGRDAFGVPVAAGTYFARLDAGSEPRVARMTVLR